MKLIITSLAKETITSSDIKGFEQLIVAYQGDKLVGFVKRDLTMNTQQFLLQTNAFGGTYYSGKTLEDLINSLPKIQFYALEATRLLS